jgi:hypothetical protein
VLAEQIEARTVGRLRERESRARRRVGKRDLMLGGCGNRSRNEQNDV